jgi:hypothetical protein
MIKRLLQSILKYAALTILSPIFFLLAMMYVCLHPNRSEGCSVIVRDCQALAGLKVQRAEAGPEEGFKQN